MTCATTGDHSPAAVATSPHYEEKRHVQHHIQATEDPGLEF